MNAELIRMILNTPEYKEPYINRHTFRLLMESLLREMDEASDMGDIQIFMVKMMGMIAKAMSEMNMDRCRVKGCENRRHEGIFFGDFCGPCHGFIVLGHPQGQAWRNALALVEAKLKG